MRKRKFAGGMLALCLALSVAGCGKGSEEQQAANYYQKELGLDKKDAEDLAHELYGKDEKEEAPSVTEAPEETMIEPLPELVNSEWYDRKAQIYDMVFNYAYMTEEDIRKIVERSASDVELKEGFDNNGNVELKELWVDEYHACSLYRRHYDSNKNAVKYGLLNEGDYYEVPGYQLFDCWYDNASIEFKDFKTRDDVLTYLSENGFVEVEKEQAPYYDNDRKKFIGGSEPIRPDEISVEFADVPHYFCRGVQSITFFRIHKLGETDQVIEKSRFNHYSGAHLNLVNCVSFLFHADGTIDVSAYVGPNATTSSNYVSNCQYLEVPGWYRSDLYNMYYYTQEVEVMGERID